MSTEASLKQALADARTGKLDAALASVRSIVRLRPRDHDAAQMLALLLVQAGQPEQALPHIARAVAAQPRAVQYRNNYANVLLQLKRESEAAEQWRLATEIDPSYERGWLGLACALGAMRDSRGAIEAARRGLALRPGWPELTRNLAMALESGGQLDKAIDLCFDALEGHPHDAGLRSQLLMMLNYTSHPAAEIFQAHQAFGAVGSVGPDQARTDPDPARPLRIGILSSDLRTHSVAFFAEPLLRHAPEWARLHVFSTAASPGDPMTRRLKPLVAQWTDVGQLDDAALDRTIRAQRIDILLDLAGHTGGNRLAALALKPAPVIVSAIAYPNTTGHPAIDWRVVDSITDPPGAEALATERLLRLDPCFLCYAPPADAPVPAMPTDSVPITFGSFNAASKIGAETAALWAGVLAAVPGSRMLVKTQSLSDPAARERLLELLEKRGIARERVDIVEATPTIREHLQLYSRIHVALDTSPYNGTTTTCEALWMGVPVVTIAGDRHVARVGASLLAAIGRGDLVASSAAEFTRIAAALVADRTALESLRQGLRASMQRSPLLDGPGYAQRFYAAMRGCWSEWCARSR